MLLLLALEAGRGIDSEMSSRLQSSSLALPQVPALPQRAPMVVADKPSPFFKDKWGSEPGSE